MTTAEKFNKENTIYKIVHDIDLEGETLTIPSGCTLDFQGGKIINGTIQLSNTKILPNGCNISDYITTTITGNYAVGQCLYDTSLNKPKWWNGIIWVTTDLTDTSISKKGTTASRPILTSSDSGFMYYDTDLSKYIVWSGSAWTNVDGTALA